MATYDTGWNLISKWHFWFFSSILRIQSSSEASYSNFTLILLLPFSTLVYVLFLKGQWSSCCSIPSHVIIYSSYHTVPVWLSLSLSLALKYVLYTLNHSFFFGFSFPPSFTLFSHLTTFPVVTPPSHYYCSIVCLRTEIGCMDGYGIQNHAVLRLSLCPSCLADKTNDSSSK